MESSLEEVSARSSFFLSCFSPFQAADQTSLLRKYPFAPYHMFLSTIGISLIYEKVRGKVRRLYCQGEKNKVKLVPDTNIRSQYHMLV